jgi:peroxiredoxin
MWFASTLLLLAPFSASRNLPLAGSPDLSSPSPNSSVELLQDAESSSEAEDLAERQRAEMEAYEVLNRRFENEMEGHAFEVRELRRVGNPRAKMPPSPVMDFYPTFEALAEEGNGAADMWLVSYASTIHEGSKNRALFLKKHLDRLAGEYASGAYWFEGLDYLKPLRGLLGEEYILEIIRKVGEQSQRKAVVAKALYTEASILTSKSYKNDPARRAQAEEIWRILVDGYPSTEAAKMAGSPLFESILNDLREAQLAWLEESRKLGDQGVSAELWPRYPIEDYATRVQAIGATGHKTAKLWSNVFLPGFEQAYREGTGPCLAYTANWYFKRFGQSNQPWNELKFELVDFLFENFPDDDYVLKSVEVLGKWVDQNRPESYVPVLDKLILNTTDDRIRLEALLHKGRVLLRGDTDEELYAGLECLDAVAMAELASDSQRTSARELAQQFRWCMPGAEHPVLSLKDVEQVEFKTLDYRGQIFLMHFWSLYTPGAKEELRWITDFYERNIDLPVTVLGINCDMNEQRSFRATAKKYGITWRNSLHQKRQSAVPLQYHVSSFPTTLVIDAEGVIRGRSQSHEEIEALVQELLGELGVDVEVPSEPVDMGRLLGQVRYEGSTEALPKLEATEDQVAMCSSPVRELNLADRSRLVSKEGGLANVAISIEVPTFRGANGAGSTIINERHCRFEPHVTHVPIGSTLFLRNSDTVSRAIAAKPEYHKAFQIYQEAGDQYKIPLKAADRFEITSSTHPWMSAWVVVSDSRYLAVSGPDGSFQIPDLPTGTYVAHWWHEGLGEGDSAEFTIQKGKAARIEIVIPE